MKNSLKIFLRSIGVSLTLFLLMLSIGGIWWFFSVGITKNTSTSEFFLLVRIYPVWVSIVLVLWVKRRKAKIFGMIEKALRLNKEVLVKCTVFTLLSLLIFYGVLIISGFIGAYKFIHFGNEVFSNTAILKRLILVVLVGNIFVAIGEEIMFRGFLLNYITNISKNKTFGLLFSAFIFSLHPYPDFLNNIIAFLAGITMGYAYLKFRTLYIPMGIHFAYNVFNLSIASEGRGPQVPYLIKLDYPLIADGFGAWVDLFIISGFIVILAFLLIKKVPGKEHRSVLKEVDMEVPLSTRSRPGFD